MARSDTNPLRFAWRLLKGTILKFIDDNASFLAAGLAFNLLLYCVPFLLLVISTLAYTLGSSERALARVQGSVRELLPQASEAFANMLSTIIANRNVLGLVAVPLFLLLSSWLFGATRLVLNVVFEVPKQHSYIIAKVKDFVLIIAVACLVILSVGLASLLTILQTMAEDFKFVRDFLEPGWLLATKMVVFLFTAALFYTLYRFSTNKTISRRAAIVSAFTGAGLFALSKWAFTWYVALLKANTLIYGALAALIFFYLWLYYACIVFILAAEVGWVYDRERRRRQGAAI